MLAVLEGDPTLGMSLLLCFHAYLRTGELLALQRAQVDQDQAGNIIVALGQSKSGKRLGEEDFGLIEASTSVTMTRFCLSTMAPHQLVVNRDAFAWRRDFGRLISTLQGVQHGFRPYSLRRGGATHAYMTGLSLAKGMLRGRWTGEKTAGMYIMEATTLLYGMAFSAAARQRLETLARERGFPE